MALTIVHKASPRVVDAVLARLQERGVDAIALDDPNPIALLVSFGTYRVRIGVPEEEAEGARRILADWDRESAPRLHELAQRMRKQFRYATVGVLIVGALLYLVGGFDEKLHWLLVLLLPIWFGLLLAFGAFQRARERGADA